MALLTCTDLSVGYEGRAVLSGLNFSVCAGDMLYILGENGSGKSTLMKTVLGLLPPLSGAVEFGEGMRKNEIGMLPQQTALQRDFPATVWEIVLSGFLGRNGLCPFYSRAQKETCAAWLEKLELVPLKNRCYRALSGGQQQRVLLARALCASRKLLLLDEPTAALDPSATASFYRLIGDLNREGITVMMISHDPDAAKHYASHILHLGKTVFFGKTSEFFAQNAGLYPGKEG